MTVVASDPRTGRDHEYPGPGLPPDLVAVWERRIGVTPTSRSPEYRIGATGISKYGPDIEVTPVGSEADYAEIRYSRQLAILTAFAVMRTPAVTTRVGEAAATPTSADIVACTQHGLFEKAGHLLVLDVDRPFTVAADLVTAYAGIRIPRDFMFDDSTHCAGDVPVRLCDSTLGNAAASFISDLVRQVVVRDTAVDIETELAAIDLVRSAAMPPGRRTMASDNPHLVYEAVSELIERNFRDPNFTTESIAQRLHLSRRHLYRQLADAGVAPASMIVARRLRRARKLILGLSEPDLQYVAAASGFSSATTLRNRFRAEFGMTPDQFRRANIDDRRQVG